MCVPITVPRMPARLQLVNAHPATAPSTPAHRCHSHQQHRVSSTPARRCQSRCKRRHPHVVADFHCVILLPTPHNERVNHDARTPLPVPLRHTPVARTSFPIPIRVPPMRIDPRQQTRNPQPVTKSPPAVMALWLNIIPVARRVQ